MGEMKTILLDEIKNPKEKEVLQLLHARGLIKYQYRSSNIELNVKLR